MNMNVAEGVISGRRDGFWRACLFIFIFIFIETFQTASPAEKMAFGGPASPTFSRFKRKITVHVRNFGKNFGKEMRSKQVIFSFQRTSLQWLICSTGFRSCQIQSQDAQTSVESRNTGSSAVASLPRRALKQSSRRSVQTFRIPRMERSSGSTQDRSLAVTSTGNQFARDPRIRSASLPTSKM